MFMKNEVLNMYYSITIAGKKISDEDLALITDVVYTDNSHGSDVLTIRVTDPEFKYIGSKSLFIEDNKVLFEGGWEGDTPLVFEGYISVIDVDFPATGSPSITINCMDNSYIMNRRNKSRTWENVSVSTVVKKIFKEYGFKADVDNISTKEETIAQSFKTDIEFILELAQNLEDEYIVNIGKKTASFKRKDRVKGCFYGIQYRTGNKDIVSFNPRINKEKKKEEVEKSDVDTKSKKVKKAKVTAKNTTRSTKGNPVVTSSKKVK